MKKKVLMFLFAALLITGFANLHIHSAMAEEITEKTVSTTPLPTPLPTPSVMTTPSVMPTPTLVPTPTPTPTPAVSSMVITQHPSKTSYGKGEELDLSDMILQGYYVDGTSGIITDYTVMGYNANQIGAQTVIIYYQSLMTPIVVTVIPAKVTNVTVASHDTTSFTLTWDAAMNAVRYEIYLIDETEGTSSLYSITYSNSFVMNDNPGTSHSFQICAVEYLLGIEYKGALSDVCFAATNPETVANLMVDGTSPNSISLSWSGVSGATGYQIYRSPASTENYALIGVTDILSYTDENLSSGTGYHYIVYAYTLNYNFQGGASPIADTSTNPSMINLKYKVGDGKIRFAWTKVTGSTSYDLFIGDDVGGYALLQTFTGNCAVTYIAEGLVTGNTYQFYAVAHREYNGVVYDSPSSVIRYIEMVEIEPTSATGKYFSTENAFYRSWAYRCLTYFSKYVNYLKSYVIPGLKTTNVAGFTSTTMCPQGITFAGKYLLTSAYDIVGEENSVIYVTDKATGELLTTVILPSKPHAGGIAFDGTNVWVTNGSKVCSILFSDIKAAAKSGEAYVLADYNAVCSLGIITSYCTYYNGKLWVGTYNELKSTNLYSYVIHDKDESPFLVKAETMLMPTRVQGISFTNKGTLILSRSCQLYKGLRGYMRQLEVYKPDISKSVDHVITLGKLVNCVSMPSMNEGIAVNGYYLYVNFESGAFDKASYKMDRICAFKLTDIATK